MIISSNAITTLLQFIILHAAHPKKMVRSPKERKRPSEMNLYKVLLIAIFLKLLTNSLIKYCHSQRQTHNTSTRPINSTLIISSFMTNKEKYFLVLDI